MNKILPLMPLVLAALFVPWHVTAASFLPPAEPPVRLRIPSIHASIPVVPVGITHSGMLDTPHNFVQAGWYEDGVIPGQPGSAVIDGHVDNGASVDGVFKHLSDLRPGDDVYVTTTKGTPIHFKVLNMLIYPRTRVPMGAIIRARDGSYLRLITCHGTYIQKDRTYNERLVVTATLVK